jgi:hypothetical protein
MFAAPSLCEMYDLWSMLMCSRKAGDRGTWHQRVSRASDLIHSPSAFPPPCRSPSLCGLGKGTRDNPNGEKRLGHVVFSFSDLSFFRCLVAETSQNDYKIELKIQAWRLQGALGEGPGLGPFWSKKIFGELGSRDPPGPPPRGPCFHILQFSKLVSSMVFLNVFF